MADITPESAHLLSKNFVVPLREIVQVLVVFRVVHVPDVSGIFRKNRACMRLSSQSGFRVMRWSIRTDGLLDLRPGWSSRRAVFWAGLRQNVLQFAVRISDGGGVVVKGADGVHQRRGLLYTIQWNFVKDGVTRLAAKVELMFRNPGCGKSA
jgi:hypothetical protein